MECEAALREIGADKTADIYRKAVNCFGNPLPADRSKREDLLEKFENEEISDFLYRCDMEFYACPDDFERLLYRYTVKNKDSFVKQTVSGPFIQNHRHDNMPEKSP